METISNKEMVMVSGYCFYPLTIITLGSYLIFIIIATAPSNLCCCWLFKAIITL
jgi:hypothetical protein